MTKNRLSKVTLAVLAVCATTAFVMIFLVWRTWTTITASPNQRIPEQIEYFKNSLDMVRLRSWALSEIQHKNMEPRIETPSLDQAPEALSDMQLVTRFGPEIQLGRVPDKVEYISVVRTGGEDRFPNSGIVVGFDSLSLTNGSLVFGLEPAWVEKLSDGVFYFQAMTPAERQDFRASMRGQTD